MSPWRAQRLFRSPLTRKRRTLPLKVQHVGMSACHGQWSAMLALSVPYLGNQDLVQNSWWEGPMTIAHLWESFLELAAFQALCNSLIQGSRGTSANPRLKWSQRLTVCPRRTWKAGRTLKTSGETIQSFLIVFWKATNISECFGSSIDQRTSTFSPPPLSTSSQRNTVDIYWKSSSHHRDSETPFSHARQQGPGRNKKVFDKKKLR